MAQQRREPLEKGRCNYGRAAIESARAGLAHIRSIEPHEYLALFLALGLLANTRGIWHAIDNRDSKDPLLQSIIVQWRKKRSPEIDRFRLLLVAARDALLKEWMTPIVSTGAGGYQLSLRIPRSEARDAALTEDELEDRESTARFVAARGGDPNLTMNHIRIDILGECEAAIALWEREIIEIEAEADRNL